MKIYMGFKYLVQITQKYRETKNLFLKQNFSFFSPVSIRERDLYCVYQMNLKKALKKRKLNHKNINMSVNKITSSSDSQKKCVNKYIHLNPIRFTSSAQIKSLDTNSLL